MIRLAIDYVRDLARWLIEGWNRFWFTPEDPATLCLIRILAGGNVVLYPPGMDRAASRISLAHRPGSRPRQPARPSLILTRGAISG